MIKYKIKYNYETSDSFTPAYDCIGYLEVTWANLDIVKENLQRIKEHYQYYTKINSYSSSMSIKEIKAFKKEHSKKDWFVKEWEGSLKLKTDNGVDFQISAPWCGHFERLNEVEIEADKSDMKISFR